MRRDRFLSLRDPMFGILPYLWMAFIAAVILIPTVVAVMNRPKKVRVKATEPNVDGVGDGMPEEQQVLDFGDELAQLEPK